MSLSYEKYRILFERGFGSNPNAVYTPQQQKETLDIGIKNTVLADYIWLPLRFDGEWPILTGWTSGNLKTMNRLHSLHF